VHYIAKTIHKDKSMTDKLRSVEIQQKFGELPGFTIGDLRRFYVEGEPGLNENTLLSRIFYLKKKGLISNAGRGRYTLQKRSAFHLVPGDDEKLWHSRITAQFPHIRCSVWSSKSLDSWLGMDTGTAQIIVEADRDATVPVFNLLKEHTTSVFLSPDRILLQRYIPMHDNPVIVIPLITEAPLDEHSVIPMPTAEKLIVDILAEPILLARYQGKVMRDFITRVMRNYQVNRDRLGRYAARRNKKERLKVILRELSLTPV
jgi:hypothetical protein